MDFSSSPGPATCCDGLLEFQTSFSLLVFVFVRVCVRVCVCELACVCVRTGALPAPPPRLLDLEFKHPNCLACKIAALFSVHVTCADAFLIPGPNTCYLPHFKAKSLQISLFPAGYKTRFNPYPVYVTESRRFREKKKKREKKRLFQKCLFFISWRAESRRKPGAGRVRHCHCCQRSARHCLRLPGLF